MTAKKKFLIRYKFKTFQILQVQKGQSHILQDQ